MLLPLLELLLITGCYHALERFDYGWDYLNATSLNDTRDYALDEYTNTDLGYRFLGGIFKKIGKAVKKIGEGVVKIGQGIVKVGEGVVDIGNGIVTAVDDGAENGGSFTNKQLNAYIAKFSPQHLAVGFDGAKVVKGMEELKQSQKQMAEKQQEIYNLQQKMAGTQQEILQQQKEILQVQKETLAKINMVSNQLKGVSNSIKQINDKMQVVLNKLDEVIAVVQKEVRHTHLENMKAVVLSGERNMDNMLQSMSENNIYQFLSHCDDVMLIPGRCVDVVVKNLYGLKLLSRIPDSNRFDQSKYSEFICTMMNLFVQSTTISSYCVALRHRNFTLQKQAQVAAEEKNKTAKYLDQISNQIDKDYSNEIQPILQTIIKNVQQDKRNLPDHEFGEKVFQDIKSQFSNTEFLFCSWSQPEETFGNSFYPYRGNDKTVVIPHGDDSQSYIHYWENKWNRNMLFYQRGQYKYSEDWRKNVDKCGQDIAQKNAKKEYGTNDVSCNLLFMKMKDCLEEKTLKYAALGCISGEPPVKIEATQELAEQLPVFNFTFDTEKPVGTQKCGNDTTAGCSEVIALVYVIYDE